MVFAHDLRNRQENEFSQTIGGFVATAGETSWAEVVKIWVLKVPGLALLAALLFVLILIVTYLMYTPECERRSFVFGIEADRTKLPKCSAPPTEPKAAVPKQQERQTPPAVAATPTPTPKSTNSPNIPASENFVVSFAESGREDIRQKFGLTLVQAESASLQETPNKAFGFVWGTSLISVWRNKLLDTLTVRSVQRAISFEIQTHANSARYIVGFVRGDVARQINESGSLKGKINLYNTRYKPTDAIIAIPLDSIRDIEEADPIELREDRYIPGMKINFDELGKNN